MPPDARPPRPLSATLSRHLGYATVHTSFQRPEAPVDEFVTLRLPFRIIKCLMGLDENIGRVVELICEEKFKT